jgi:hypothetical protein
MTKREAKIYVYDFIANSPLVFAEFIDSDLGLSESEKEKVNCAIDDFCCSAAKRAKKLRETKKT